VTDSDALTLEQIVHDHDEVDRVTIWLAAVPFDAGAYPFDW
jgi:hypothetical protein